MKNSRGFTLVELLIVIMIISVLSTILVVSITKARPAYQLHQAGRDIVSAFRTARSMAIKFNRSVVLAFDTTNGFYTLDGKRIPTSGSISQYYGSSVAFGYPGRSDGVHFSDGSNQITFDTTGLPTGQVTGYVYLKNQTSTKTGVGYRIGVSTLGGNIKLDTCGSVDCRVNP